MFPGVCIAIPHWRDYGKQFSMRRSVLMEPRTFQYMLEASEGERLSGAPTTLVRGLSTDSRQIRADDLFVALRGDRFDGHQFVAEAARQGVAGVVLERSQLPPTLPDCGVIAVENTRAALGKMAARYRQDFNLPIIAVGGSNGKTTTKELLAAVLRQAFNTLSSRASFNNDIGVPTTLLELTREHQVAVLEFGTNHPGELAPLLRLARPCFGVITSIGREHLEYFEDLAGVLQEEGSLAELLPVEGKLFLNGDTPGVADIVRRCAAPVSRVGLGEGNHWRARGPRMDASGICFGVESICPAFNREFHVPLFGRHQAVNALLAVAVGAELGLTPEQVQRGLEACPPAPMRLQLRHAGQVHWLDDAYNANADSVRAALETLCDLPCQGRRVAVLGEMGELGKHAEAAHAEVGRYAAATGVEHLITVGRMAGVMARSAREAGLGSVEEFEDLKAAAEALRRYLRPQDLVLLKASRAAALERVREFLWDEPGEGKSDADQGRQLPGAA